ncbi:hypothetical protein [Mycobacterium rhizamassiliense]|jgi:hypothetical protein|nr:hypothetical protein [Mycobacterium rhizamassiliense]
MRRSTPSTPLSTHVIHVDGDLTTSVLRHEGAANRVGILTATTD